MKGKSYLVTGGAGFIGSHVVARLLDEGAKNVRVLDNLSTGNRANVKLFEQNPAFEFIEGDIRDMDVCAKACEGIQGVFHHAALLSVPGSVLDPAVYHEVNVTGFLNILIAARNAKCARVVYASSSAVYGDNDAQYKYEDAIGNSLSPYASTKYMNELYGALFSRLYGLSTVGLRYFNVFGPRQDPGSAYAAAIPKFITKMLEHKPITIFGDGLQTRDFVYIKNIVNANMKAMEATFAKENHNVLNVGTGEAINLIELTKRLGAIMGEETILEFKEPRPGDALHSCADITRAKELIDYTPQISLSDGLRETIEYYKTIL